MKVLIVGSGGREHAIALALSRSLREPELYCLPGNAGIDYLAKSANVAAENIDEIVSFATANRIDFVVIGPEVPLAMGLTDLLEEKGISVFGPNKKCARLEASKSFTKHFLQRHKIPTAKYLEFTDVEELRKNIGIFGYPMVLKADGLAAGKGVIIAEDAAEAEAAVARLMTEKTLGAAGEKVVVEECLLGTEASLLCFVDKTAIVPMESAQDYKRIFDGDKGPNTGGMGTYSPSYLMDAEMMKRIEEEILLPTWKGFAADGLDFHGVLFVGLMLTAEGPKVIEFNNRFGDPEAQSVLPRLKTDLLEIMLAVTRDELSGIKIEWRPEHAVTVVLASGGYPNLYEKGKPISGLENFDAKNFDAENIFIYHAGTKCGGKGEVVTAGGRVLGVTALAGSREEARANAYAAAEKISFEGMQYRKDIGDTPLPPL
jgi:phosphoribosylamine--glycine ligase